MNLLGFTVLEQHEGESIRQYWQSFTIPLNLISLTSSVSHHVIRKIQKS